MASPDASIRILAGICDNLPRQRRGRWPGRRRVPSHFELRSGEAELSQYRFGSGALTRFFCKHCGVQCFARGRGPGGKEFVGINLNTLEDTELSDVRVVYFDGRHDVFEPRSTPAPIFPERRTKS
jgi:hypothetical protein